MEGTQILAEYPEAIGVANAGGWAVPVRVAGCWPKVTPGAVITTTIQVRETPEIRDPEPTCIHILKVISLIFCLSLILFYSLSSKPLPFCLSILVFPFWSLSHPVESNYSSFTYITLALDYDSVFLNLTLLPCTGSCYPLNLVLESPTLALVPKEYSHQALW